MRRSLPLDAVDSRLVLLGYALIVGTAGVLIAGWGSLWLGGPLLGVPWGLNSIVRVAGMLPVAAACCAFGCSRIKDPIDRRRTLGWLVVAHLAVLAMAWLQLGVVWGSHVPPIAMHMLTALATVTMGLGAGYGRQTGDPAPLGTAVYRLFGDRPAATPVDVLRSSYEAELRRAGAREERQRFARDLHDSVKQQVFAIQTAAATADVRMSDDPTGAREAVLRVREAARDAMSEMDAMLDQLKSPPVENAGLVENLGRQVEACRLRTGADATFDRGALPPSEAWPPGAHEALFRAAQEAISNVARHARAAHLHVSIGATPYHVTVVIRDDGAGFDTAAVRAGMGLENLQSRMTETGGTVEIASAPGRGTVVTLAVPYERDAPRPFLRRAIVTTAIAIFLICGAATQRPGRDFFIMMAAPLVIDAARYLAAWIKARRLVVHSA
jgi:signal transduction histidine kinase